MRMLCLLWAAVAAWAQDADSVLQRARAKLAAAADAVPKYTCTQTVDRSYYRQLREQPRSCDAVVANQRNGRSKLALVATDRLRFDVEVSDGGYEIYAWPGAARISGDQIEEMAGGPFGSGPFGPFLIDIFTNPAVQFQHLDGYEYRYRVPVEASHYRVRAGVTWSITGYDGTMVLDPVPADLKRLTVRTGELAAGTGSCEATTTMDFERQRIGAGTYLLPRETRLRIIGRDAGMTENATVYRECREFRGESAVRFEDAGPGGKPAGGKAEEEKAAAVLPGAIPIVLDLDSAIDCSLAAAGDAIAARVVKRIVDPASKRVLVEAGAAVHGRIAHLERHIEGENYYLVGVRFETVETPAGAARVKMILDRANQLQDPRKNRAITETRSGFRGGGTFLFPARDQECVVPRGYRSTWITLPGE